MVNSTDLLSNLYNAFNPFEPLPAGDPKYVDCQDVRGDADILQELGNRMQLANTNTCQLYSGHRGAGKSTELLRLKKYLENRKFYVVYFAADEEDIDSEDAQYTDILLACTRRLLKDLKGIASPRPILDWLKDRWVDLKDLALTPIEFEKMAVEVQLAQFAKLTANLRAVPELRQKIRQKIDPHTVTLIQVLNEFLVDAKQHLPNGYNKLAVIVDNLDRMVLVKDGERTNYEEVFLDRSETFMNPNLSDWDDDLPPEPEEAYQDLLRALRRKSGFGLFFVQCTPGEADKFIVKLPQEIPQKKVEVLRFVEPIDNLYKPVAEFVKDKQVDILLIKGLEYSLYKYEKRSFGEITEGQFSNLTSVPHILNHLNQQRERFRDDFAISFVFLLRSFSINYFIHRAPDFFDWRSGVFELSTTPDVVEQESNILLDKADYEEYLKLSHEKKIEKVLEIQDLISEKHQTENCRTSLLFELGNLLFAANEYEAALTSYDKVIGLKIDNYSTCYKKGETLRKLGRYEEAITNYNEVIVLNPDDYWTWYHRGLSFSKLGRYYEAITSYDQALKINNKDIEIWGNRGMAFYYLGIYEQAVASYDKAIEIKPECCAGVYYYKACCFAKQDIIELTIENLQRAIAISHKKYQDRAKTNSDFDAIRENERFKALIKL